MGAQVSVSYDDDFAFDPIALRTTHTNFASSLTALAVMEIEKERETMDPGHAERLLFSIFLLRVIYYNYA